MAVAIVQATSNAHNATDGAAPTVHFGSAPTAGHLMLVIASVYDVEGNPTPPAGWTVLASSDSGATLMWMAVYYRYAQAGDSSTQEFDNNGRDFWAASAWEIGGVSGTIGTDVVGSHLFPDMATFPSTTGSAGPFNTADNNSMVLAAFNANASATSSLTITSTGFVQDSFFNSTDGAACSSYGGHYLTPTAPTAISASITYAHTSGGYGGFVEIQPTVTNASASGAVGTATFSAPTGGAVGSATPTGAIGTINTSAPAGAASTGAQITVPKFLAQAAIGIDNVLESPKFLAQAAIGIDAVIESPKMLAAAATGVTDTTGGMVDGAIAAPKFVAYAVLGPPPPRRPAQVRVQWNR